MIDILSFEATHCFATWRNVLLVVWRRTPARPAVEALIAHAARMPGDIGMIARLEGSVATPDADVRAAFAKGMKTLGHKVKGFGLVHEETGFAAAAVRGAVTGILLLSGKRDTLKMFSSVTEAAAWLAPRLPGSVSGREIVDVEAELRREIEARERRR